MSDELAPEEDLSWRHSPNAMVWAEKFVEYLKKYKLDPSDPGTMVGWFANAMVASDMNAADVAQKAVHSTLESIGEIPIVAYKDGCKNTVGTAELRLTVDGFAAVVEMEETYSHPVSLTAEHLLTPSLRANPYDPAIYGMGISSEGRRMVDEIDRNARAYGYEVGCGHPLTRYIPAIRLTNPFLDSDWKKRLVDGTEVANQAL